MDSRRSALIKIAAAATSAAFAPLLAESAAGAQHAHEFLDEAPAAPPAGPSFFNQSDYETLSKLVDLIIPHTDTPGALAAGVPHQVDRRVAANPELQKTFQYGLAHVAEQARAANVAGFAALAEPQQIAILETLSNDKNAAHAEFFKAIKDMTIDAYYSSEPGLVQELGFKGNTFRTSFPGCTHPEHWPIKEHA